MQKGFWKKLAVPIALAAALFIGMTPAASSASASETVQTTQLEVAPYSGSAYTVLNNNIPNFTDEEKASTQAFETYSELDELGRCGVAYANICKELMPTEERGDIGDVRPSGWHTVKYNDLIDGNYLYNRCHLIGYQLAGENANERNLITGTRYLNTEGMLPFENLVANYVESTGYHVLYRVTPVFEGDNLVASGVQMEAWSVEDGGAGICFHVYCYNVQPCITIDYLTGDSSVTATDTTSAAQTTTDTATQTVTSDTTTTANVSAQTYILNTNTKKFHLPSCSSVGQMATKNKKEYQGTIDEIKGMGYEPCKKCLKAYAN